MKNIIRICRITYALLHCWLKKPNWSFGQLIENIQFFAQTDDLYYTKDSDMLELIHDFYVDFLPTCSNKKEN